MRQEKKQKMPFGSIEDSREDGGQMGGTIKRNTIEATLK